MGLSSRDDTQDAKDYIPAKPAFQGPGVLEKGRKFNHNWGEP